MFLAGGRSHGYGTHEHYAGCMLLAKALGENVPDVQTAVFRRWPDDPAAFEGADAVAIICDSGQIQRAHLEELDRLAGKGVGVACFHYALAVPKGKAGECMLRWIGGYYETHWSVNPVWTARFERLPEHPIARGVRPFAIRDEWYYHMRFQEDMAGVTPILTAVPPDSTRKRPFGAHSGNPHVRARMGKPEHVAWAYRRPGGGRGFGFTGGHWHWNWAHDDVRTLVLNALLWVAGREVPPRGVPSQTPSLEELQGNLDTPPPKGWRPETVEKMLRQFDRSATSPK
ncbi:MAG: ThuA domain-containing protein [Candidatus Brocadiia bacterium]